MIKLILRTRLAYLLKQKIISNKYLKLYLRENTIEKKIFLKNLSFFRIESKAHHKNILVQQLDSYELTIKIAAAVKSYSIINKIKVYSYYPYFNKKLGWINIDEISFFRFYKTFTERIYKKLNYKLLFSFDDDFKNQKIIKHEYHKIIKNIKSKKDLIDLKFKNIHIGDLIYDTYLRFYKKHTVENLQDNELEKLIYNTINSFYLIDSIISKKRISCLFTSYTSYINHGLTVRICLNKQIPVYVLGSNFFLIKKIKVEFPYHCLQYKEYHKLDLSQKKLTKVENEMKIRFSGGLDNAIGYMKKSSFTSNNKELKINKKEKKRNVVVFAHDIYDSPHLYKKLLYDDLYCFITELCLEISNDNETFYWIKLHPNAIGDCNQIITEFINNLKSTNISILTDDYTNLDIIKMVPDLVVTVNGTVGIEMPYFNIPVVALADNPYMNFSFVKTCDSLKEYYDIIKGVVKFEFKFDKKELYSFYYLAYIKDIECVDENFLSLIRLQNDSTCDNYLDKINANQSVVFNDHNIDLFLNLIDETKI
jgi:hypothetical protein